jgi:hypothetical protein
MTPCGCFLPSTETSAARWAAFLCRSRNSFFVPCMEQAFGLTPCFNTGYLPNTGAGVAFQFQTICKPGRAAGIRSGGPFHGNRATADVSLIGAGPRIRRAIARPKPGRGPLLQAIIDPVAEGRTRRRLVVLAQRRVHLRHHGCLDPRWRRWWRQRRVELRSARQNGLRQSGIRGGQRRDHRADCDQQSSHGEMS